MKICVECEWFKGSNFGEIKFHECLHPECRNPVSGRAQYCVDMRKPKAPCGKEGLQHVPVHKQTVRNPR